MEKQSDAHSAEDDLVAARGVSLMLRSTGAVVDHADTGEEGLELAKHYDYDIVVLDLMLPDIEGFEVVRRMRISRNDTPVLILSGLSRPQIKVKGLGLGTDDFITKPFDKAELLARMQAIVRRSKGFSQPSLRVGPLLLNLDSHLDSHEVAVDGQPVHLTGKEYAILELLVLRKGTLPLSESRYVEPDCEPSRRSESRGGNRIVWPGRGYRRVERACLCWRPSAAGGA